MYLARMKLQNWRSYDEATFTFDKPRNGKPIVLVGAMNGHGKTSFLLALYLGIFGPDGLRYCEGFRSAFAGGEAAGTTPYYRKALEQFRRDLADPDEPTQIEVEFAHTLRDSNQTEGIRIVRRWYFTANNKAKPGEGFEDSMVYVGGKPIPAADKARALAAIETALFPAHVMPAFIFDGEQAQSLIERSGEQGLRNAVEVMFGSKVLQDASDRLRAYVQRATQAAGGKKRTSGLEDEVLKLEAKRTEENESLASKQQELSKLKHETTELGRERAEKLEQLQRQGAGLGGNVKEAQMLHEKAGERELAATRKLDEGLKSLALPLAMTRMTLALRNRLQAEQAREEWESLRTGTLAKKEEVVQFAMPEPAASDPLLGHLTDSIRQQLRQRLISALERIYNPPPPTSAPEYLMGFLRGEARSKLLLNLDRLARPKGDIRAAAHEHQQALDALDEAKLRKEKIEAFNNPELDAIKARIEVINESLNNANRRIGDLEREAGTQETALKNLGAEIGRLREQLSKLEPEQKRLALAERTQTAIDALIKNLEGTIGDRLAKAVTKQFLKIADERFQKGRIEFEHSEPVVRYPDGSRNALTTASGFESRSFGVAFTLALAELTRRRLPLVIDTPLGNADSKYRPRMLKALTDFDLDQVIILTHDQEVTPDLVDQLEPHIGQKMLVEFDQASRSSTIHKDRFFAG